jgi:hypothetical protein
MEMKKRMPIASGKLPGREQQIASDTDASQHHDAIGTEPACVFR